MTGVQQKTVTDDETDVRLDRWFQRHFPHLTHGRLEKLLRTGQVRIDGKRAKSNQRLLAGQIIRVPPMPDTQAPIATAKANPADAKLIASITLFEDDDVLVLNKPFGLAVQGGSGTPRHIDGILSALYAERPRLVHRLDKDTSGVLIVAKNAFSASKLAASFRGRDTRKYYWAATYGVPTPLQGGIKAAIAKNAAGRVVEDDEEGKHATTLYQVIDHAGKKAAFVALWPLTGRTHQLRAHLQMIETPIIGDDRYAEREQLSQEWPIGKGLHLHARRLIVPHPRHGILDHVAPLPAHMLVTWKNFNFSQDDGDIFQNVGADQ